MTPIATYVYLDLETTGLPQEENNKTKITELSMIAVKREHILDTRPGATPRVQHKLTLCFNPKKLIQPSSTEATGLCNDLLEHEPTFDMQVYTLINTFLNVLTKPVCLIAQNGHGFDFPIIKNNIQKLGVDLSDDLMCADCYHGFYEIMEATKNGAVEKPPVTETPTTSTNSSDETDLYTLTNTLNMKLINESTPKQSKNQKTPKREYSDRVSKARRRFVWSEGAKPKDSYKLKDIHERLLNRPGVEAHRAENDCILALECSVALSKKFIEWVDENCILFRDVKPMTIGVPLK